MYPVLLDLFALRWTEYPIATACFGSLPAAISVSIFFSRASLLFDLMRGMVII
jgi:hypothetical protein